MNTNLIVKLGVVALVIGAVAVVLRLKQDDAAPSPDASSAVISEAVLNTTAGAASAAGAAGAAGAARDGGRGEARPDVDTALPRLLDLGANRCVPCKKMAPILEALRADFAGRFEVVFIDVWKDRQAAKPYGVRVIPTQIFYDAEGNELFRHQGFYSREDILAAWSELGYEFTEPAPG